jgi:hypothetical protein
MNKTVEEVLRAAIRDRTVPNLDSGVVDLEGVPNQVTVHPSPRDARRKLDGVRDGATLRS